MSIQNRLDVIGSSTQPNIHFNADFDCNETVILKENTVRRIQKAVAKLEKMPFTYVSDLKAGLDEDYNVLSGSEIKNNKVVGFDESKSLAILNLLKPHITSDEYDEGLNLLKISNSLDYLKAKQFFKFHICHWNVNEIKNGEKKFLDKTITLKDALEMKSVVKLDVITYLYNNTFVEFSCIYFIKKGRRYINPPGGIENLEYDAIEKLESKNYFKYLKRVYSLSLIYKNKELGAKLEAFFNSKVGFLYKFIIGLEVLIHLLEFKKNIPLKKVHYELDLYKTIVSKFAKEDYYDDLVDLNKSINLSKLSKLHSKAYSLLQVKAKDFLHSLE